MSNKEALITRVREALTTETIRATASAIATVLDGLTLSGSERHDYAYGGAIATVACGDCLTAMQSINDLLDACGGTERMPAEDPAAAEIRALLRSQECVMLSHGCVHARDLAALQGRSARLRAV